MFPRELLKYAYTSTMFTAKGMLRCKPISYSIWKILKIVQESPYSGLKWFAKGLVKKKKIIMVQHVYLFNL